MNENTDSWGSSSYQPLQRDCDDPNRNFEKLRGKWVNERRTPKPRVIVPVKNHKGEHSKKSAYVQEIYNALLHATASQRAEALPRTYDCAQT